MKHYRADKINSFPKISKPVAFVSAEDFSRAAYLSP